MVGARDKPLVWLHCEIKTPPLSRAARLETGVLFRRLQRGESLSLPMSRPMPAVGRRCHELRINDPNSTWRVIYRVDVDAIVIVEVFSKKTSKTPRNVVQACKKRLRHYDAVSGGGRL
jgi:phage-related protein